MCKSLDGLPADYIARHSAGADGQITLTTDEPGLSPGDDLCQERGPAPSHDLAYNGRAYPANEALLAQVLKTRGRVAKTLDFSNWAESRPSTSYRIVS